MTDIPYTENEERKDFNDFDLVYNRWKKRKQLKDRSQMKMYHAIANCYAVGKSVIDVGCGMGIGTNLLGHEALGAWGVDINQDNVDIASALFDSRKTKFHQMDITAPMERPFATFDLIVCIEVIEHVKDYEAVFAGLKKFYDPARRSVFFISSPNRNSDRLGKEKPNNVHHVREWTAGEFYEILTKQFRTVVMYSASRLDNFSFDETCDGNTNESPILAKCEDPIL